MAERSFITQVVQVGMEDVSTPGTLVVATRRMQTLDVALKIMPKVEGFRPQGFKFDTVEATNQEWTEGTLKIGPTYTELIYPFSSVINNPAMGQPVTIMDGLTDTTGRRWVFESSSSDPDTPLTMTIEQGSSVRAQRAGNFIVSDYSQKWSREKIEMSGKALASLFVDNHALTGGTTTLPLVPIIGEQCDVYLDATYGGLGTTKLGRFFSGDLQIASRFGAFWVCDSSLPSFAGTVETEPKHTIKVIVEADASGMSTLLPLLRNNNTMFLRVKFTGPNIYTGGVTVNYGLQQDFAVKVTGGGEFTNQQGIYGVEFDFTVVHDSGWGKALHWELVNKLTAL